MFHPLGKDGTKPADWLPDRVSLLTYKEAPICAAGADTSSRVKPFVCQTTPHFGSTSREVSYSVPAYHTTS